MKTQKEMVLEIIDRQIEKYREGLEKAKQKDGDPNLAAVEQAMWQMAIDAQKKLKVLIENGVPTQGALDEMRNWPTTNH